MRTIVLIAFILLSASVVSIAQQAKLFPFKINGHINADTGKIKLEIVSDTGFYPKGLRQMETRVINGSFSFEGLLPYPVGVQLNYGPFRYNSAVFVIERGEQSINCNIDSSNKVPVVDNRVMSENANYKAAFGNYNRKHVLLTQRWNKLITDYNRNIPANIKLELEKELKQEYAMHDSVLLNYVSAHPNSWLAFWNFVNLSNFGYENIFDTIFANFSDSIKNTYSGIALANRLKITGTLAVGKKFKYISSVNKNDKTLDTNFFTGNKYTLVDFWYSHCGPCRAQFPDLRNVYAQYKNKGLEIVAISTDKASDERDWKKAIQTDKLIWPQYWDRNGKEASKVYIAVFPTNFLLDNKGMIVKKDISPVELADFLNNNLR